MADVPISARQMKRLQTLWGLFCRQANLDQKDRGARLGWVGGAIGRSITSFSELSGREARTAIDAVQKHLPPELLKRPRPGRGLARAYGTAGRKGFQSAETRLVDGPTLSRIAYLRDRLGWTQDRLTLFLQTSRKSPVRSGIVRTQADGNKVFWMLKSLLRRAEPATQRATPRAASETAGPDRMQAPPVPEEVPAR